MHTKAAVLVVTALVLGLALPASAQECSIQAITGVYAYRGTGQSFMGGAPLPLATPLDPANLKVPLHAPGANLNGSQLGTLTIHPDGTVDTLTWLAMGPLRLDPAGERMTATVTSIGWERTPEGDLLGCLGTIDFVHPLLGPGTEKFLFYGNEIRGVHAMDGNPITGGVYVGKRITRTLDAAPRCGAHTLNGSYVASCDRGLIYNSDGTTFAMNSMIDLKALPDGSLKGKLFNRIENRATETMVNGAVTVNPDCTGVGYLYGLIPAVADGKAHFVVLTYEQGKGAFIMPTELELPSGVRVAYPTTQSCMLERMAP